jgi:tripartite-type tricarboxylate transporter receptor subunit TctC
MRLTLGILLSCFLVQPFAAHADTKDTYPQKSISLIVPYAPGGLGDTFSRALARGLNDRLGQAVIVENKSGASQIIGMEQLQRKPADGYTLFLGSMTSLATNLGSHKTLSYDPVKDVAPISKLFSSPLFLAVGPKVPVNSVKELAEFARAKPGELTYASFGAGSSLQLAGELFAQAADIELLGIPYKGSSPALLDVMSGVVTMIFDGGSTVIPQVEGGKLRALATTGKERSPALKDVPTMAEAGFPSVDVEVWWGLVARQGTPDDIVERLAKEVNAIISDPEFSEAFRGTGIDIQGSTPEEFGAFIQSEAIRWPAFMKEIGMTPQ